MNDDEVRAEDIPRTPADGESRPSDERVAEAEAEGGLARAISNQLAGDAGVREVPMGEQEAAGAVASPREGAIRQNTARESKLPDEIGPSIDDVSEAEVDSADAEAPRDFPDRVEGAEFKDEPAPSKLPPEHQP
jgi:hypothetical protein